MANKAKATVAPRLVSLPVAAEMLSVSRGTMHRLIASGELPAITAFKYRRIDVQDLEKFIQRSKEVA